MVRLVATTFSALCLYSTNLRKVNETATMEYASTDAISTNRLCWPRYPTSAPRDSTTNNFPHTQKKDYEQFILYQLPS